MSNILSTAFLLLALQTSWAHGSVGFPLHNAMQRAACAVQLSDPRLSRSWKPLRKAIHQTLTHRAQALDELSRSAPLLENAPTFVGNGVFGDVYRVESDEGTVAVKVWRPKDMTIENYFPGIVIQWALGEMGLSPKVRGILSQSAAQKHFKLNTTLGAMAGALIMDYVPGAQTQKAMSQIGHMSYAPTLKRRAAVVWERADLAFRHLLISPYDTQLLMSRQSDYAFLNDFDLFTVVSGFRAYNSDYPDGINALSMILLNPYTNDNMTDALKAYFFQEAPVVYYPK